MSNFPADTTAHMPSQLKGCAAPQITNEDVRPSGLAVSPCSAFPVLDACCGSRMFWFDRADPRAVFVDNRCETHELADKSSAGGKRSLVIAPDIVADFTALPFADESFALVCFDPPHYCRKNGGESWMGRKYGTLPADWREMLRKGFAECFRVLKREGTLVFKWHADEIPVSQVLALTPERPLFGNRCGKTAKSHWLVFIKLNVSGQSRPDENEKTL